MSIVCDTSPLLMVSQRQPGPMDGVQRGIREVSVQNQDVAAWLEAAVPRLVRELAPERILLFGSWARRTALRNGGISCNDALSRGDLT